MILDGAHDVPGQSSNQEVSNDYYDQRMPQRRLLNDPSEIMDLQEQDQNARVDSRGNAVPYKQSQIMISSKGQTLNTKPSEEVLKGVAQAQGNAKVPLHMPSTNGLDVIQSTYL